MIKSTNILVNNIARPLLINNVQSSSAALYKSRNFSNKTNLFINKTTTASLNSKPLFVNETFIRNSNIVPLFSPKSVLLSINSNKIISSIRNYTSTPPKQDNNNNNNNTSNKIKEEIKEIKQDIKEEVNEIKDEIASESEMLKKLSTGEKIKYLLKKYGKLALIVHFGIYFATMGGFYLLFSSGVDINHALDLMHIPRGAVNPSLGAFAVAFACTKLSTFIRTPITIITVPLLARYLSRGKK